jgi:hypothetical protein
VPGKTGNESVKLPIASFCCESGRWSRRGNEDPGKFSSPGDQAPTNDLKIAVRKEKSQQSIWEHVAKTQMGLGAGLGAAGGAGFAGIGGGMGFARPHVGVAGQLGGAIDEPASPTSLQLTLENVVLRTATNAYRTKLRTAPDNKGDVIGYVVAVNGKITGAEVYGSNAMFKKVWPTLLKSSVTEAIAGLSHAKKFEPVTAAAAEAFLLDLDAGERTITDVTKRVRLIQRETDKGVLFETRDRDNKDSTIRRSYIAK